MKTYGDALLQLKRGFLIIGLTGYTGSGCTTARRILNRKRKTDIPAVSDIKATMNPIDYKKLTSYWSDLPWTKFVDIEVSRVIFMLLMLRALRYPFSKGHIGELRKLALPLKSDLIGLNMLVLKKFDVRKPILAKKLIHAYKTAGSLYVQFKNKVGYDLGSFIETMQNYGDNIRKYGQPLPTSNTNHDTKNIFVLPEAIRRLIKAYRSAEGSTNFVIDAFRNPYEVEYFKRRYSEFYLISINRAVSKRHQALNGLDPNSVKRLDKREKGQLIPEKQRKNIHDWVTSQNIDECAQKADYFIFNHYDEIGKPPRHLVYHLVRLISLTKYPGLIPPTDDERSMQLAMVARQNSGCLSRHVGAVVTDEDGYILGVGWNDPPTGQVPCSLRTADQLLTDSDEGTFSEYERSKIFIEHIRSRRLGNQPFCFREELAVLERKPKKSEFTRALHAEENALFQATRHGGEAVKGSILYTTDSPCPLCAKKAYQLGVKRIVYIEEYPGIAKEQTLKAGSHLIQIEQFEGAMGSAYFDLFTMLLPEKDFLNLYA
jgi:deoxycytidylate deaminase